MNTIIKYLLLSSVAMFLFTACGDSPKVISSVENDSSLEDKTGIFSDGTSPEIASSGAINQDVHTVVIEEVLPTSKYVYLYVKEGEGESFWIATTKQEVEVGKTYYYKGGLLKTNFESKEYNRIFDKMYLVSRVVPVDHGGAESVQVNTAPKASAKKNTSAPRKVDREGSIKIAELVNNPEKYDGQIVQISGECVKVNPNIMDRNWLHMKDGSKDDYDLVITSDKAIPEGHVVTMKGRVVLNKDFGAGYRYDILIEEGVIVQ